MNELALVSSKLNSQHFCIFVTSIIINYNKVQNGTCKPHPRPDRLPGVFYTKGTQRVREINRAYMLLWLHKGKKMAEIEDLLAVERTAIWRTKKNYQQEGLQAALKDKPRPGQPVKYKPAQQAEIIALACSDPPEGRERWTLELLASHAKIKQGLETINRESIRLILKKTNVNLS